MISVQGKFLCNNITEGFTFFRYNRDTKFEHYMVLQIKNAKENYDTDMTIL